MAILVTGGAGFIGRHTVKLFCEAGEQVVILDNLCTGRRPGLDVCAFVEGDIADTALIRAVLRDYSVTSVIHLAASAHVGDSIRRPEYYYANNVSASLALLEAMLGEGVRTLVFASSCSVYGHAASQAAQEVEALTPVSPYGESKLVVERALEWYERAHGLRWISLRYFNAAGAEEGLGEEVSESTRIIPRAVHAVLGDGPALDVYGTDMPTRDGSAVRDYVHVADIARANLQALRYLEQGHPSAVMNIGTGVGFSVLEIIAAVGRAAGLPVPFHRRPARTGDPAYAVADPSRAHQLLGWTPLQSGLEEIVASVVRSCRLRAGLGC